MTSLINSENLNKMREAQEMNLPETVCVQRKTVTSGADGFSEAWTTVATVSGRLGDPKGDMEKSIASTVVNGNVLVVTLPVGTAVLEADQLQVNGVNYKIHWMNKDKSHLTALRVVVSEV